MKHNDAESFLKLKYCTIVLLGILLVGTIGFWALEEHISSLLDSFLFTLITITTVGYGNVTPQTVSGKVLTIIIIFLGVGTAIFTIPLTFEIIISKKIKEVLKMPKEFINLKAHYIICGYGKIGRALTRSLQKKNLPFIVVEKDDEKVKNMVAENIPVIEGDAQKNDTLKEAGVAQAKCLMTTLEDTDNVFIVLTAKALNPDLKVVCKIEDDENMPKLKTAGADETICCHDMGAQKMIEVSQ